jgi:hypothetical protein
MKKEAISIAAAAAKIAQRAARLSAMAGIDPVMMGSDADFYNIGHDSLSLGEIQMYGVEPEMMGEIQMYGEADFGAIQMHGDADFGEIQMYGEDEGMMGGLADTLKTPMGMALLAAAAFFLYKKMKK